MRNLFPDLVQSLPFTANNGLTAIFQTERFANPQNALEYLFQRRSGECQLTCSGQAGSASLHVVGRDGTYFAMRLRNQQIGTQLANQFRVNVIQGLARSQATPNFGVDLPTRNGDVKRGSAAGGKRPDPSGVIAFVRTPYQHFARAQGTDDFCGTRQQRNNAHATQPAAPVGTSD